MRQAGAIQVGSIEELIDMALLFTYVSPPRGKNVAVIGFGGGASVLAADSCAHAGLTVPKFSSEIRQQLAEVWGTEAGRSFKNPVDTFSGGRMDRLQETIRVIYNYKQIDILIMHVDFNFLGGDTGKHMLRGLKGFAEATLSMAEEINKPTAFVLQHTALPQAVRASSKTTTLLYQAGVPVFPSMSRAANAISKFIQYHNNKREGMPRKIGKAK